MPMRRAEGRHFLPDDYEIWTLNRDLSSVPRVPSLLERIEANAEARLTLPAGRRPTEELARYRNFLKVESHRLRILHRAGGGGREVCRARAAILDLLLSYILQATRLATPALAESNLPPIAIVAIGGYGRGELNPNSDIDFMFLHNGEMVTGGRPKPTMSAIVDGLLYPLWDIGLKVGHSVRSIADCIQVANEDMQSKTSLIEARLITGNSELFKIFQKQLVDKCVTGHEEEYIAMRVKDQAARHSKYGNSATMQEPNIKNGCGGLRDYQNMLWMTFFKYRTRTTAEMVKAELVSTAEGRQLDAAYDYLLRARNELHYHTERAVDVLSKSVQPAVANNLGYKDPSPSKRLEAFMGDFYSHSRNIYLITRTVEQRLALRPKPVLLPGFRKMLPFGKEKDPVIDGFKFIDGEIHAAVPRIFRDKPERLMRVFLYAQQRGLKLHPDLAQVIRQEKHLVDKAFRHDEHVRATFLEILNSRGNVARILRAMHEVDFLGKYIPEFGRLTSLVQHEFYHQYTTDEHTLVCLEKLDQVWEAQQQPFSNYAQMFREVERPFVLYLALLLHDAGKADHTGKHSEVGGVIAQRVARRLELDGATTHNLRLLIENHLVMANTSQRRDLEDENVVRPFAALMQSPENLRMLTLHTLADSLGTSDQLWNSFKDSLLLTLYRKTYDVLISGTMFVRAEKRERELLEEEIAENLPRTFGQDELHAHFEHLPARYFQLHNAREIAADLSLTHRFMHLQITEEDKALEPVIAWHNERDRGYTTLKICTWDRLGLFSKITGSLSAAGINILSSQSFTRTDGIALDTFYVTDAQGGSLVTREERERFEEILLKVLTLQSLDLPALIAKQRTALPRYQSVEGERIPTRIDIDNNSSNTRTIIEVETEDRIGLLYALAQVFAELELNIAVAKILTERGAAVDTFYVTDILGQKIEDAPVLKLIERRLREAIAALDAPRSRAA
jgi:[protein-PII] uridylyltransferase